MPCPTASAIPSFGTLVQYGKCDSPETYYTISGVGDITGPATSVTSHETTNHGTGGAAPHRKFRPTLIDDGSISFPINYDPSDATHDHLTGLEFIFQNRQIRNFRLVATDPSATTRQFQGFVEKLDESYQVAGILMRNVSIKITSVPTRV